ncbi:MAG: LPS-assembly protein LptD [Spirochaetales bacterium]|nr:LPS-assembly protein LptD [Spirochaetales bacterium]
MVRRRAPSSLCILLLLTLLLPISLFSQENGTDPPLEQVYFDKDLELSSLEELRIWCRSLDLDDAGSEGELRERLRAYYAFAVAENAPETPGGDVEKENTLEITIKSADSTEYYQVEDKGEEIHLTGDVVLTVKDGEKGREYVISADRIIFSRLDDSLTALGNVEYTRSEEGGSEERFLGESMTFHIEGWQGVIYSGVSSRTDSVDGKDIEFYFTGREINSSGFDLAVMKKGTITSGVWEDPEYSIRAGKIWLMGPEEWGLVNGVLYLGRIPLLYLPFYYKPGNDIFFNPSIGFRDREGVTLQTSTYLIGRKSPENTSFFSAGLNSDSLYELERKGLFLFKGDKTTETSDEYLKLMADYYSRLGGFVGLDGHIKPGESANGVDLFAGVGVSRSIDSSNNNYFLEDGLYVSRWNTSSLGALELPFRWGVEASYGLGNFNFDLKYYSDPAFMGDFMSNRVENFDPLNFLLSDLGSDNIVTGSDINSFSWKVSWKKNFATKALSPWLNTVNVTRLNGILGWQSERDDGYADTLSPTADFFYPDKLTLPDGAFSLSGTLWQSGGTDNKEKTSALEDEWLIAGSEQGGEPEMAGDDSPFEVSPIREERSLEEGETFSGSLKWSSSSTSLMENDFDNFTDSSVDSYPEDLSFRLDKSILSVTNKDSLTLNLGFWDNLLSLSHKEAYSISHRKYVDLTGSETDLTATELKDQYSFDAVKWDNSSEVKTMPFSHYSLDESYASYSLGMVLYKKSFETMDDTSPLYEELWLNGNADGISKSELECYLKYKPGSLFSASSRYKTSLYTDDRASSSSLANNLTLTLGPFTQSLSQSLAEDDGDWTFKPIEYTGTLDLDPLDLVLKDALVYDTENERLKSNQASLNGYGFSSTLRSAYTHDYTWNTGTYLWEEGDESFQLSSLSLGYSRNWDISPLWKDRIKSSLKVGTSWNQNLIKISDSVLDFNTGLTFSIHEFMDLSFSMVSSNKNMYLYIPSYRETLGITQEYSLWEDLFKSFNFFNPQDRVDSFFNLSSLDLDLTHYLGNWNFILNYSGSPKLQDNKYQWQSVFSFYLKWDPVPTLNIDIQKDKEENWDITAGETE